MARTLARACLVVLAALLPGCGGSDDATNDPAGAAPPGSAAALEALGRRLVGEASAGRDAVSADAADLLLPDPAAFFTRVFGDEPGSRVAAAYAGETPDLAVRLAEVLAARAAEGRTEAAAFRIDAPDAAAATSLQAEAVEAMQERVPLFTLELRRPGARRGYRLWSFVFDRGAFRFAGRLTALLE